MQRSKSEFKITLKPSSLKAQCCYYYFFYPNKKNQDQEKMVQEGVVAHKGS